MKRLAALLALACVCILPAHAQPTALAMDCLGPETINRVKESVSITPAIEACAQELDDALAGFEGLTETDRAAMLAVFIGPRLAPYGNARATTLEEIMAAETLSCSNLIHFVANAIGDERMDFIGFEGGAVGNHAQIIYHAESGATYLLDPTIGLIAKATFDELLMGRAIREAAMSYPANGTVQSFSRKVSGAVTSGAYRPSDLLYFYEDYDHMRGAGARQNGRFITPGGVRYREKRNE